MNDCSWMSVFFRVCVCVKNSLSLLPPPYASTRSASSDGLTYYHEPAKTLGSFSATTVGSNFVVL